MIYRHEFLRPCPECHSKSLTVFIRHFYAVMSNERSVCSIEESASSLPKPKTMNGRHYHIALPDVVNMHTVCNGDCKFTRSHVFMTRLVVSELWPSRSKSGHPYCSGCSKESSLWWCNFWVVYYHPIGTLTALNVGFSLSLWRCSQSSKR